MEATGVTSALSTALNAVAGEATAAISAVLPIALPVMGAVIVIGIGVKVFKRFVK